MKLLDIQKPVTQITGVGPSLASLFARLNIFTVADLLTYYPKDWEDRTKTIPLSAFSQHQKVHTIAQVIDHQWFGYGRMKTLKLIVTDGSLTASLLCFNRPFLERSLPINSIIALTGSFSYRFGELQSSSFEATLIEKDGSLSKLSSYKLLDSAVYSLYPLTAGLSQKQIRKAVHKSIQEYGKGIDNELPEEIIEKYQLVHKQTAIKTIHEPENIEQALLAKKTLIFEELYFFQYAILKRAFERKGVATSTKTIEINLDEFEKQLSPLQEQLLHRLSFELTPDQKKVIMEMNLEIDKSQEGTTMAQLLQGDVGSGKTLVSFFACLRIIDYGEQCALMAPTEILSKQHGENAAQLLSPLQIATIEGATRGLSVAFLSGNIQNASRIPLLKALKEGEIDIIVGTHALFSKQVQYNSLKLAIIDEQHRFGVVQRNAILDKGRQSIKSQQTPNLLMMSATPIPQTLSLTVYGDLDISTIKTMPSGRKPIQTHLTKMGNESRVYEAVRLELQKGHQAYFVYPRIENQELEDELFDTELSEQEDKENQDNREKSGTLKSAEEMYTFLSEQVYPEYKCALVHSKVSEDEQNHTLELFRKGQIQVLVATTVVEVGVDVPNATCMVIEQAERFGLAALHQLRGRVGRGKDQSQCFLIYGDTLTELGKSRLKVMHESTDGFFIAEEDLRLRGPGELSGIQQSGYLTLGIADPIRDRELLEIARKEALYQLQKSGNTT